MFCQKHIERTDGGTLFLNYYIQPEKPYGNIIFCCTPVLSVDEKETKYCYAPFIDYGYNVFAFGFYGTCNSDGHYSEISHKTIISDFETIVADIRTISDDPIYLFAGTGIGGIIGQCYAATNNPLTAFAQYGQVSYREISFFLKTPKPLTYIAYQLVNGMALLFPKMRLNFPLPKYIGVHAEQENALYKVFQEKNPEFFRMSIRFIQALFWFMYDKESPLASLNNMPTLVIHAKHDRYFPNNYVETYYNALRGKKRIVSINDCHSSYIFHSDYIAEEVNKWFQGFSRE